jgi:hypothetical protein
MVYEPGDIVSADKVEVIIGKVYEVGPLRERA